MTGRGLGYCGGFSGPGFGRGTGGWGPGRGWGRGFVGVGGGGRGWRHRFWATGLPGWMGGSTPAADSASEQRWLEARARALESEIDAVRKQLEGLARRDDQERGGSTG